MPAEQVGDLDRSPVRLPDLVRDANELEGEKASDAHKSPFSVETDEPVVDNNGIYAQEHASKLGKTGQKENLVHMAAKSSG